MSLNLQKRLARADLNLLPVLHVLIETQSTKATADQIGRTQSAVSHALNRLREMLGDPLFVRHGPKLDPTPLLLQLKEPLARLLQDTASFIETGTQFDPAQSDRTVVVACFDLAMPLAQALCQHFATLGPNLSFRITGPRHGNTRLATGEVDLLVSLYRNAARPGQDMSHVATLNWAFFADPALNLPAHPTAQDWSGRGHVQVHTGGTGRTPIDDAARVAGVTRTVALKVEGFTEALYVARQSGLFFSTFPDLAAPIATKLGLQAYPLPFDVPPAPLCVITRQTRHDPMADWLHREAVAVARKMLSHVQP